ncbi:cilia- and flagella- associated protein 210 [Lampris incognitus]|uniref:cilia- and flagella- associated protein 210 n=1 Tax=Lampris incognitus TaxID=2546036 RepID=UPI0024B5D6E0|nr:cilia- and flagella- associated protein 210 [Lampris incognitus]
MASRGTVVRHGRRAGSGRTGLSLFILTSVSLSGPSAEEDKWPTQAPDLRQVTVLPRAEWLRIQDSLNRVDRFRDTIREAAQQREALHLRSKEMVKFWSNTIAGQRQKKLEAKKIQEETEEEKRKLIDIEEAKFQEQMRKEAIEKAKAQLFYQTDRVKGLHSALLLTKVLQEREAQIELKRRRESNSKDMDKELTDTIQAREDEAARQEQQRALWKKLDREAVVEELKKQTQAKEVARERDKLEDKKEGEEIQRLHKLYLLEQSMERQKQVERKKTTKQAHMEHLANRDNIRAIEGQERQVEEGRRKCFLSGKQKMMKLRKDKELELFRETQMHRDRIIDKIAAGQQEQAIDEEELTAKAIAEQEAKQAQQQRKKDEEKAAMLKSISEHRELTTRAQEQKDMTEHKDCLALLQARREADRIFLEKQLLKAQKTKEDRRALQEYYVNQMAEKRAWDQQLKDRQQDFEAKTAELVAEEEGQFQQYAKHVIDAAKDPRSNVFPLRKAARGGIGGGLGPVVGGLRPSYLVQDDTGVQLPKYVCSTTQNIKGLNETVDIERAKKRLGLTWS